MTKLFEKGVYKGGPGRPRGLTIKPDPELKQLLAKALDRCVECLLHQTRKDFQEVYKDENSNALDYWFAGILLHGGKNGDGRNLAFILDRVLGKVPIEAMVQTTQVQSPNGEVLMQRLNELAYEVQKDVNAPSQLEQNSGMDSELKS